MANLVTDSTCDQFSQETPCMANVVEDSSRIAANVVGDSRMAYLFGDSHMANLVRDSRMAYLDSCMVNLV